MGSNMPNETSSDCEIVDLIDLDDTEKTAEDEILEWGAKIRKRLKTFAAADCNKVLGAVMKEYFSSVQLMAKSYEDHDLFKKQVFDHIHVLYLYYTEMKSFVKDVYLKNMENILTLYCNLELTHIDSLKQRNLSKIKCKKRQASAVKRIIHVLTMYLLERRDLILHVLMKMDTSKVQQSFPEVLKALYMHFLLKVPEFNLSDESFCRNYIVFQKWKEVQDEQEWPHIDKLMYGKFKQSPESILNNETLKKILMPPSPDETDVIMNIFCSYRAICNAYFKHINTKQTLNINDFDFNIDLEEDEPSSLCLDDDDSEEVLFQKKFSEVERSMSTANFKCNAAVDVADMLRVCKSEPDDDDVEFVGYVESPSPEDSLLSGVYDFNNRKTPTKICKDLESMVPSTFAIASSSTETRKNEAPPEPSISPKGPIPPTLLPEVTQLAETAVIPVNSPPPQVSSTEKVCHSSNEPTFGVLEETVTPIEKVCDSTVISDQLEVTTTMEKSPTALKILENRNVDVELSTSFKATKIEGANLKAVETKSIKVQTGSVSSFYGYSGIPTPPFDGANEEQNRRNNYNYVYANAKREEIDAVTTRTVDVQVDLNDVDSYNDYGLTPPNDTHSDDATCINEKEHRCDRVSEKETNYSDNQNEVAPSKDPGKSVETCKDSSSYHTNKDDLDTGQKTPVLNGNLVKRTNGQNKDTTSSKILFSTSKQRLITGDEFSKFEEAHWSRQNENQELDDFFLGPVTKATPIQASTFLSAQDQFNIFGSEPNKPNSGSSSPVSDSNSPLYEQGLDDFKSHYHEMKRHHPPPLNCKVPPGILKKGRSRRNSESSYKEEKKRAPKSPPCGVTDSFFKEEKKSVQLPKTTACSVRVERLEILDQLVGCVKRIDFDKSSKGITQRDVVRYLSPPRMTVILPPNMLSPGSLPAKKTEHLDKKPKKRKNDILNNVAEEPVRKREILNNFAEEPVSVRKRASRTPKKTRFKDRVSFKKSENSRPPEQNNIVPISDNDNSLTYSSKPFRPDFPAKT